MSDYVKATNFTAKDSLPSGNSGKIVKGSEIDTEFNAIASAISSKTDTNSPAFTGTPTAPTASTTTNTTQIATTAFVNTAITNERTATTTLTNKTLTSPTINGGAITGITDLTVADGGTGASSITANSVILGNGSSALNGNLVAPSTSGNVLTSNGTTWISSTPNISPLQIQLFTSSGSWTAPTGVTRVKAIVIGGGAGGGAGNGSDGGQPGGFGGYAVGWYTVVPGTTYTVTVGAGGAGGSGYSGTGASGGSSSFGSFCSATGGSGGTLNAEGNSGNGSNGTIRNLNQGYPVGDFDGADRTPDYFGGGQQAARTWTVSSTWRPGARGAGGSGVNQSSLAFGAGGLSGLVYLEYVA